MQFKSNIDNLVTISWSNVNCSEVLYLKKKNVDFANGGTLTAMYNLLATQRLT